MRYLYVVPVKTFDESFSRDIPNYRAVFLIFMSSLIYGNSSHFTNPTTTFHYRTRYVYLQGTLK